MRGPGGPVITGPALSAMGGYAPARAGYGSAIEVRGQTDSRAREIESLPSRAGLAMTVYLEIRSSPNVRVRATTSRRRGATTTPSMSARISAACREAARPGLPGGSHRCQDREQPRNIAAA